MLKNLVGNSYLFGANAPYIEELYESYIDNPGSVPEAWRGYFDKLQILPGSNGRDVAHAPIVESFAQRAKAGTLRAATGAAPAGGDKKQVAVLQMIAAYRFLGVRWAQLDPLQRQERPVIPELEPAFYGLVEADLDAVFNTGTLVGPEQATLRDILKALKDTYCASIGAEYMYISDPAQKRWIQQRLEGSRSQPNLAPEKKRHLLERLTAAETLERYLHTRYVGQKRFSLEGGESTIPLLDELIQRAGSAGAQELVIGMAHRGRLNVLISSASRRRSCSPSSRARRRANSAPAMSNTTSAFPPTSRCRAGRYTCRWHSIRRIWRSSIRWWSVRYAHGSGGAATWTAPRRCPS